MVAGFGLSRPRDEAEYVILAISVATIYGRRPGLFPAGRNVSLASGVTMTRQTAKAVSAAITQAVSLSRQISHVHRGPSG